MMPIIDLLHGIAITSATYPPANIVYQRNNDCTFERKFQRALESLYGFECLANIMEKRFRV